MISKQQFRLVLALIGLLATLVLLSCKSRQVALNKHSSASQSKTKTIDKSVDSLSVTLINKSVTKNTKTDSTKTFETDSSLVSADSIWLYKSGDIKAKGNAKVIKKSKKQVNVNTKEVDEEIKDLIERLEHKHEADIVAVEEVKKADKGLVKEVVSKPSMMVVLIPILIVALIAFVAVKWNWLKTLI